MCKINGGGLEGGGGGGGGGGGERVRRVKNYREERRETLSLDLHLSLSCFMAASIWCS